MKAMGNVLRSQRQNIGYSSLETFANNIGMDSSLYGRYERGENLKIISLARLLIHHNVKVQDYFNDVNTVIGKMNIEKKK